MTSEDVRRSNQKRGAPKQEFPRAELKGWGGGSLSSLFELVSKAYWLRAKIHLKLNQDPKCLLLWKRYFVW